MTLQQRTLAAIARALSDRGRRELCGFVLEGPDSDQEFIAVENWAPGDDHFVVAPAAVERATRFASRYGRAIVAFLHSHPRDVSPSDSDRISMRHSPWPWIIVASSHDRIVYRVHG